MFREGKPDQRRRRSDVMHERVQHSNWAASFTIIQNEPYLNIGGKNYRILDSTVTDFCNYDKPLVYLNMKLKGEIIILDPASPNLEYLYQELKAGLLAEEKLDTVETIEYVKQRVKVQFTSEDESGKAKVLALRARSENCYSSFEGLPVILLETFITQQTGVCRHQSLLLAYLLNRLLQDPDKLLPEGNVYYHRDTVASDNAHAWVIYKPYQFKAKEKYDCYLIDSTWNEFINLADHESSSGHGGYGESALEYCIGRHNQSDLEKVAYTSIKHPEMKNAFIAALLRTPPSMRRKYLHIQYQFGALKALQEDMKGHPTVRTEIDEVILSGNLLQEYFNAIPLNLRPQFITGLLSLPKEQRLLILESHNISDLTVLSKLLLNPDPTVKTNYHLHEDFADLFEEIDQLIELKSFLQINYSELETEAERKRFLVGLFACKSKITWEAVLNRQSKVDLRLLLNAISQDEHPQSKNYLAIKVAIEMRLEGRELLNQAYSSLGSVGKTKYFHSLLAASDAECNASLAKQDSKSLRGLQRQFLELMQNESPPGNQNVLQKINLAIHLQLLQRIKAIAASSVQAAEEKKSSGQGDVTFWVSANPSQLLNKYLSQHSELIDSFTLESATLDQLMQLTQKIRNYAKSISNSASAASNYNILNILSDETLSSVKLLRCLEKFQSFSQSPPELSKVAKHGQ